jgi:hypothetical protein
MVGNAKLVIANFRYQPRPETSNPCGESLLAASPGTFCSK